MATSGFLKVDRSSLKTIAMKETPFNAPGFPTKAKDAYNYVVNPNTREEVSVVKPQLNSTIGVKPGADTNTSFTTASWGGFVERPTNKRGYYFPLDSNLSGYDLQDMIEDPYENKITAYLKSHPEVVPEGYKPSFAEGRDIATVCSNLWDEKVENGGYGPTGSKTSEPNSYRCKNLIPVLPNTEYTFVAPDGNWYINYYDARGLWFYNGGLHGGKFQFTTSSAAHFISFWRYNSGGASSYTHDVAVVKGTNGVYEPYYEGVRINNVTDVVCDFVSERRNLWDEQTVVTGNELAPVNLIPVESDRKYFINTNHWASILAYDSNGAVIGNCTATRYMNGYIITPLAGASFFNFNKTYQYGTVYKHDICIQMIAGDIPTEKEMQYIPYHPPITITLPSIHTDLHGLPSTKDKVEFVNRVYENMKVVDLGSLNWERHSSVAGLWHAQVVDAATNAAFISNIPYGYTAGGSSMPDKSCGFGPYNNYFYVRDTDLSSVPAGILHYEAASGGQRYKARVLERKVGNRNLVASEWIPYQRDEDPFFYSDNVIADAKTGNNILNASGAIRLTQMSGSTRLNYPNGTDLSKVDLNGTLIYELATPQLLDVTEAALMKPVEERIPNIVGSFSTGYENDGLCTYEGAFPSRTNIVNLIDNSTIKNNWVNAVVSVIGHTPINARDGISILPSNMSNDTRRTFSFTPTTTGKYHFSFYARLSGDARSYSSSSLRGISLTISPNPTASYDIAAPRLIRGSNIYNLEYEWNRYGKCISLNANTTYTITLNWYASNNWRRPDTPLKICGVLLESGSFLSPYDVKGTDINGTGRSITSVIRPLFFNLARLDGALEDPTKSWMVTYLRKINTNSQATGSNTHGDNFGIGNYGYSGNNILGGTSTGEQASDYYNCWEKVIFYHKANEDEFKYEVFNTETNKHYSIVRSDSSITHQTVGNIQYNLSLGTLVASSSLQESDNAQYRDLLYVPNVTEEEYLAEINKYFEVEKVRMTYEKTGEDPITVTDALTIKKTNLLEGSTLEY